MAYEYGVNLKLDSEKALKDIDVLLGKLQQMEKLAGSVKLKVTATNDVEKQQREFMRQLQQMQAAEQKLAAQRQLNEEKVQQAQDKTNAQQLLHEEKVAQAQNKTATQRATNEEKVRQEQQKTATEAEKQAMDVLKANEKVRQQKEKTRQEEQRTAQAREQTARAEQRTNQETVRTEATKVDFLNKLFSLQQRVTREREREEDRVNRIAKAEQRATEQAQKRAAAVAKAVAARQKEALISQATSGFTTAAKRYSTIGRVGQVTGSVLNNVSQSMGLIQQAASQLTSNLWGYAQRIGSQIVSQVEKIAEGAFDQYKTLETAQIGFGNFFYGSPAAFTQQVREHAEQMPGVGAQDLIRGIQYIAPLAGGNSQLALDAAEGVMKSILYSGNDVSTYGTNALQNLQQLASGNFTYADIRQMLRAMPTLPSLLASSDTGKELLDNGAITTEKLKAFIKKNGQSALLELFADLSKTSAASDIYEKYRNTLSGITEEITETLKNRWNDAMVNAGVYRTIGEVLKNLKDSGTIDRVFSKFGSILSKIMNYFNNEKNVDDIGAWFDTIQQVAKSFTTAIGNMAREFGQSLGIFKPNGMLDTSGLRKLTRDISEFVKGIVKGFGGGLKTIIEMAKRLANAMGTDGWKKLGEFLGTLASPLGKLMVLVTKFGAATASVLGSLSTGLSGIFKWLGNKSAGKLEALLGTKAVESAGYASSGTAVAGMLPSMGLSTKAASKFAGFAKWGSGVLRGGVIAGIIQAAGGVAEALIDLTGVFGDASTGIKNGVKGVTDGLSAAVLAFSLAGGGKLGLLLGAVGGLITGIISYMNAVEQAKLELQQKNNKKMVDELDEQTSKDIGSIADYVVDVAKAAGLNIDTETEEGRTAYDDLKNYLTNKIVKRDSEGNLTGLDYGQFLDANGNVDPSKMNEVYDMLINDLFQQKMNSAMNDYLESSGFYNANQKGSKIDLDNDKTLREDLYNIIKDNLLNGTDEKFGGEYDYTQSQEKVIRDFMAQTGIKGFTTGGLDALKSQESALKNNIQPDTLNIKEKIQSVDKQLAEKIDPNLAKVANATEGFKTLLTSISNNVMYIARKNNADFSTFGFNGTQLGSTNGVDVDKLYDKWKSAANKGTKESWSSIYLQGNGIEGGYSVGRNSEGFQKMMSVFQSSTGLAFVPSEFKNGQLVFDENSDLAKNWKTLTTRERAAEAYHKDPNSNDDWGEAYQKIMDAYNWEATQLANKTPGTQEYKDIEKRMNTISMYADWLSGVNAGDWVMLFAIQDMIESSAKRAGIGIDFRAAGGRIAPIFRAMGGRGVDTVPAFLQPGEYVMRRSATAKAGFGVMDALNRGDLGAAARALGSKFSNSWNNSRSYSSTVNNNQKTVTNNMFFERRTRAGRVNQYYSLANGMAASF